MMLSASLWRMTSTPTWQDEIEKPYGRLAAGSNQLLIKTQNSARRRTISVGTPPRASATRRSAGKMGCQGGESSIINRATDRLDRGLPDALP